MEVLWYLCNCHDIITVRLSTYRTCRLLQRKSNWWLFLFYIAVFFSPMTLYLGPSPFLIPCSTPAPWDTSPITFLFPMGHWQAQIRIFAPPKSITQCPPHETRTHWHVVFPFVEDCAWLLIEMWYHVKVVAVNYKQALKCLWETGAQGGLLLRTHLQSPSFCQIKPNIGQKIKPILFVNIANKYPHLEPISSIWCASKFVLQVSYYIQYSSSFKS